jgi:hypothetical protein
LANGGRLSSLGGIFPGFFESLDFFPRQFDIVGFKRLKGALPVYLGPPVKVSGWYVFVKALAFAVPGFGVFVVYFVAHIPL